MGCRYEEILGDPLKDQVNQGAILGVFDSRDFFLRFCWTPGAFVSTVLGSAFAGVGRFQTPHIVLFRREFRVCAVF